MYAVFVITAILFSVAPMHAHAFLSAVMPANAPVRQLSTAEPSALRQLAPASRVSPRTIPVPPRLMLGQATVPSEIPASDLAIGVPAAAPLTHAPNAP